jgi:NAD(P) transhydrogenase
MRYDVFVIGSGPAGQKAAIQAAKAGRKVAVCEQLREVGGACVHHGTIPSKALRERSVEYAKALSRLTNMNLAPPLSSVSVAELIGEMGKVVQAHDRYMTEQLKRNGIDVIHGRASFVDDKKINVRSVNGNMEQYACDHVVIATGSKPRLFDNVAVDHETIYDSDSILSLAYLPQSMVVLGGGVIACEYASIFSLLGVRVTLVDRYPRPLGFLDPQLTEGFLDAFEAGGGIFIGDADVSTVQFDGVSKVETHFADGTVIRADKALCAMGRVSQLDGLQIERAGVRVDDHQLVAVNAAGQTSVPHIYAAGDVVGPPSLASASMEQGRRAACDMLGLDPGSQGEWIPTGIYAVPELACVGLTEVQTSEKFGAAVVGVARFDEIARGQIANAQSGMLKMVASPDGIVRGVHILGAQSTDLIHIAQMGLIHAANVDVYIENVFNFPTYAECYRVAALQAAAQLIPKSIND